MARQSTLDAFVKLHLEIRARFPQIDEDSQGNKRIYLNNGGGTLMVDTAIKAMTAAARAANPQPGAFDPGEVATATLHRETRETVADFLNAPKYEEISFHVSTSHALFSLAFALRSAIPQGGNIIVTDMDHMANVTAWEDISWGKERGYEIRRARIGEDENLDIDHLLSLVDDKTRLVALTMASNGFGTIVPLKEIIAQVKEKSPDCLSCVDAVHHAVHGPVDVQDMGCDFLAFSAYKVFGPMLGVLWGKYELLDKCEPYRVETNKNEPPYKFELGTLNNASLASLKAALEYLLWLGGKLGADAGLSRKDKFRFAMEAIEEYDFELSRLVLEKFRELGEGLRCHGVTDPQQFELRDPTFCFEIAGREPQDTKEHLWKEHGIHVIVGHFYSGAIYRHLKNIPTCRASFVHYDSFETVELFVNALKSLVD